MCAIGISALKSFLYRATVEHHRHSDSGLPTIGVTIAVNEDELVFRYGNFLQIFMIYFIVTPHLFYSIKDRGGGMPRSVLDKIFDYHFSSSSLADNSSFSHTDFENPIYDPIMIRENANKISG